MSQRTDARYREWESQYDRYRAPDSAYARHAGHGSHRTRRVADSARGWRAAGFVVVAVCIVAATGAAFGWDGPRGINPDARDCAPVWRPINGVTTCPVVGDGGQR